MKSLKLTLYIIGSMGIVAGIYGFFSNTDLTTSISGLVCGSSLLVAARYSEEINTPAENN